MKYKLIPLLIVAIALASCSGRKEPPVFTSLEAAQTGIGFRNDPATGDSLNFLDYLYYYNGGGVAIGDINNDGLADIYFTANNKGGNKLYLNKGSFRFEDITAQAGMAGSADWSTGVTMADVDGDGFLDIYVCAVSGKLGLHGRNDLYINNGRGRFTEKAADYGLDITAFSTQSAFFDYDHDGDLDCYLLNQSSHSVEMYRDTSLRREPGGMAADRLLRNDGGHFTDVTLAAGIYNSVLGYGLGLAVADLDNDGWDDLYIGNDFHENDYYYVNQHDGTFHENSGSVFGHFSRFSMGNDIADYNNDGQPDIITADMLPAEEKYLKTYSGGDALDIYRYTIEKNGFQHQFSRNALQRNLGNGKGFSEVGLIEGVAATDWSWSPLLADFDNDGIKDLFISNGIVKRPVDLDYVKYISNSLVRKELAGSSRLDQQALGQMPDGSTHNYIFQGSKTGRFADKSEAWGFVKAGYSNGAAYADLDNDGRLDLVINNINENAGVYRNTAAAGAHWLQLKFNADTGNTHGIGAKAWIYQQGTMQYQQVTTTRGFQSSCPPILYFGLGDQQTIDSIRIVWPDFTTSLIRNVAADSMLTIAYAPGEKYNYPHTVKPLLTEVTNEFNVNWQHHENEFNDFNSHRLLPHLLSARGPRLAVADINGDGLDDLYACGAAGQTGVLLIQRATGGFDERPIPRRFQDNFTTDASGASVAALPRTEETDAVFFDADGDGHPDLLVVSGGNERSIDDPALHDHLYLNDGSGNFTEKSFPSLAASKSTVAAADLDHDGDFDLFIGVLTAGADYGILHESYLLLNDGKGNFTPAATQIPAATTGMVNASAFADVNRDGWPDLILAGEWMDVQVLLNEHGKFTAYPVKGSSGLWQSLSVEDLDGDGDADLLAGNYGLNSKLHATTKAPLHMYVKDFDKNGQPEQILAYSVSGKEYTFLGKDELEVQLPSMRKSFLRYRDFAGKTVQEVFGEQLRNAATMECTTLASGIFRNDGKGNFSFEALPDEAQYAPLFAMRTGDLDGDGKSDVLTGGNFFGVSPYEGRYDANRGFIFRATDHGYSFISPSVSGFSNKGETRDLRIIRTAHRPLYVVAKNNAPLQFFK